MPAGTYSVVRYIPDPARDEPINVGIIASGPAGAIFRTDPKGWARIRSADIHVDPGTIDYAKDYIESLTTQPILELRSDGITEIHPWQGKFCQALLSRLPERFTLGGSLFIDYADEHLETMESAVADLVKRLVAPPPRRVAFPEKDPDAPFERLKRRLKDQIEDKRVRLREAVQGWSRRVREPDFFYYRQDGKPVVVNVVRLDYRRLSDLYRAADANAFILLDLKQGRDTYTIALVEWPAQPTDDFFEALKSIEAVASEVGNADQDADAVAERILEEAISTAPA